MNRLILGLLVSVVSASAATAQSGQPTVFPGGGVAATAGKSDPVMAETARVLTLYGGEKQAPVVCNDEAGFPGILTERATELLRRAGYGVRVECTAWSRAQVVVKSDPDGVIMNLARTPERESEYLWLIKTGEVSYGLATNRPELLSLEMALQAGAVAAVRGTPRVTELQAIGPDKNIVQVNDPDQAARMLMSGRVVAWYDTGTRVERVWPSGDTTPRPTFIPLRRMSGYLAAGRGLRDADQVRKTLERAYDSMQADGSWGEIGQRYPASTN